MVRHYLELLQIIESPELGYIKGRVDSDDKVMTILGIYLEMYKSSYGRFPEDERVSHWLKHGYGNVIEMVRNGTHW